MQADETVARQLTAKVMLDFTEIKLPVNIPELYTIILAIQEFLESAPPNTEGLVSMIINLHTKLVDMLAVLHPDVVDFFYDKEMKHD